MKLLTVLGVHLQLINAATVSRAIMARGDIEETIGLIGQQHFGTNMSEVAFKQSLPPTTSCTHRRPELTSDWLTQNKITRSLVND